MAHELISKELVSNDYRMRLQSDLENATVLRFLIGYISCQGLRNIGIDLVRCGLSDHRSFGVGSLTCSCGYRPLLELQHGFQQRLLPLKYFMDPMIPDEEGSDHITLFHSKVVYIYQEDMEKSIVYVGSHNWTSRALGPDGVRNAEASLRYETEFIPDHLDGNGSSFVSEINRHLLSAWEAPACLPATEENRHTFEQWYNKGCVKVSDGTLNRQVILLAVWKSQSQSVNTSQWQDLIGHGIYLQALNETEGKKLWNKGQIIVLVWKSQADLKDAQQPIILICRETTHKASAESELRGTNITDNPIVGFRAVMFDEHQLQQCMSQISNPDATMETIWNEREFQYFDFEFPTEREKASEVDKGFTPKYQYHFEVEHVAFPESDAHGDVALVWPVESFAVAKSGKSAKYEQMPGYVVTQDVMERILDFLEREMHLNTKKAKVLPVSRVNEARIGKRYSQHELHDTFLRKDQIKDENKFYENASFGFLVADINQESADESSYLTSVDQQAGSPVRYLFDTGSSNRPPMKRILSVVTTPLEVLRKSWSENAQRRRKK